MNCPKYVLHQRIQAARQGQYTCCGCNSDKQSGREPWLVAMGLGPVIGGYAGVPALFYIAMILSLIAIFILVKKVPNPPKITHTYNDKLRIKDVLGNANINNMHITNFLQKALMTFALLVIQ